MSKPNRDILLASMGCLADAHRYLDDYSKEPVPDGSFKTLVQARSRVQKIYAELHNLSELDEFRPHLKPIPLSVR